MDKTSVIFGNKMDSSSIKKAYKTQQKYLKKFGDDRNTKYHLTVVDNPVLTPSLGIKILTLSDTPLSNLPEKPLIIGNIRMGFGHYRISMAIASATKSMGYTPLWFDLNSFPETTGTKIIGHLNDLYSFGSRLSQKYSIFNKLYWEPLNSEGFRKISYNAGDQATAELMTPIFNDLDKNIPFIGTHAWPSQAAVHANMEHVVNAIPDNWPMALHLAEGSIHTVQTPSSYIGYRLLRGMDGTNILNPMSDKDIKYTGHYIDYELESNIDLDTNARLKRIKTGEPLRFLLTVGGAGAQGEFYGEIIRTLLPYVKTKKAVIFINVGDYKNVWENSIKPIPELSDLIKKNQCFEHFDNFTEVKNFVENELFNTKMADTIATAPTNIFADALETAPTNNFTNTTVEDKAEFSSATTLSGIHCFYNKDLFAAVYATNLLMRISDVLVTKPSELSYYPIPKLLIKRVGGHEMWGAIRSQEVGDGTYELSTPKEASAMAKDIIEMPEILEIMCNCIKNAAKEGIYKGAYKVVEIATTHK